MQEKDSDNEIGQDIYTDKGREELIDKEDEIEDVDEGFMKGYEEGEKAAKCPLCHTIIVDDFVEKEIDGDVYRFCSEKHLSEYIKHRKDYEKD